MRQSIRCGWFGSQEPHLSHSAWRQCGGGGQESAQAPGSSSLADQSGLGESGPESPWLVSQATAQVGSKRWTGSSWETRQDHSSWQRCSQGQKVQEEVCGSCCPCSCFQQQFLLAPPPCNGGFMCGCRLFPGQMHIWVPEVPGRVLGSSSASELRAPAGMAAGMCGTRHANSLFSPLIPRKIQESPTSLLLVMQGVCCFSAHHSSSVCRAGFFSFWQ